MIKAVSILIDVLEFVSFWMVAPEILGEKRMKTIEVAFRKAEPKMPGILIGFSAAILGILMGVGGIIVNKTEYWVSWNYFVVCFSVVYIFGMVRFNKQLANYLAKGFFAPFFQKLSDSDEFRKRSLKLGALLFTLSFTLKLLLDFLS